MGRQSEKRLSKRLGAKLIPGSGALKSVKSDMVLSSRFPMGTIRLEAKATANESFSVKLDTLRKITQEAEQNEQFPAFAFAFTTLHGVPVSQGSWVAVPEHVFVELLRYAKDAL
jgi:hypothetical protein